MRNVIKVAIVCATIAMIVSCVRAPAPVLRPLRLLRPLNPPSRTRPPGRIPPPRRTPRRTAPKAIVQGGADAGTPLQQQLLPLQWQPSPWPPLPWTSPPRPPAKLTPEEQAYLQTYLSRLNYMVYYNEDAKIDPKLAKAAVSQANRYLLEKLGLSVMDFDQIEKNKKDQQTAYESETGGSIDLIQYLAQKFNADVYVEIDFALTNETRDNKFYASAQGSMKIYDTSTATLLGSVVLSSQTAFSPNSADAAATNAIASTVWAAMPKMIDQSKELLKELAGSRHPLRSDSPKDSRLQAGKPIAPSPGQEDPRGRAGFLFGRLDQALPVYLPEGRQNRGRDVRRGFRGGDERHQSRVLARQVLHIRFRIVNNRSDGRDSYRVGRSA